MPSCICRAPPALKILPVSAMPNVVFGELRFTWLGALNISQRNCTYFDSVTWKFFINPRSSEWLPGASMKPIGELPNRYRPGAANAVGSNHKAAEGLEIPGFRR